MSDAHAASAHFAPVEPGFKVANGKAAMWLFLASDAMSFGGLLVAYSVLRGSHPNWPEPATYLGIGLTAVNTFVLICSSVSMVLSLAACQRNDNKGLLKWLGLTILGGVIFLGIQAYEYTHLLSHVMTPTNVKGLIGANNFGATFFGITGFHGMHVLGGVIYLSIMWLKARKGAYNKDNFIPLEMAGLYWHFVDLIWILVFTIVYLLPVKG